MASAATMSSTVVQSSTNDNKLNMLLPQPSPEALLQRQIEDTLMLISELPETKTEKIVINLPDKDGHAKEKRFEIQRNQLDLFLRLEALVEELSPEQKKVLIKGLHPAMSVREREALKVVLERGFGRFVVPKRLEVRKAAVAVSGNQRKPEVRIGVDGGEGEGDGMWEVVEEDLVLTSSPDASAKTNDLLPSSPTPIVDLDVASEPLVFPELTLEEMRLRAQELSAARLSQGILPPAPSTTPTNASSANSASRRRRQEIANTLSLAAKKLQVKEGETSSGLGSPVYSPTLKEGLQLIRSATSALREFTDVTPREVVVMRSGQGSLPAQSSGEMARPSTELSSPKSPIDEARAKEPAPTPADMNTAASKPGPSLPHKPLQAPTQDPEPELSDSTPPPTPPPKKPLRFHEPPPIPSAPKRQTPTDPVRPRSDPSHQNNSTHKRTSTCPWPESFFTAPRTAPLPPQGRSVSLPQPPRPPQPQIPTRAAAPAPLVIRKAVQIEQIPTIPQDEGPTDPSSPTKKPGSISAARAGIEARVRQAEIEGLAGRLPATRASVAGKWAAGIPSPTGSAHSSAGSGRGPSAVVEGDDGGGEK